MVNLHFWRERSNVNNEWIHALAIPLVDVQRLSLRPLKWLRFAAFAVLGSKGDLYDEPGPDRAIVDYDVVSLNDDADYFFVPNGGCSLIDYEALNHELTSSSVTARRANFRASVADRDGNQCVITSSVAPYCDAAHVIPHAKGNAYIEFVIAQRRSLYENWYPTNDIDIDMTENGMFVTADIHRRFGMGDYGFLRTPNFALSPDDIPRMEDGEIPALRVTLQLIKSRGINPTPFDLRLQGDVHADWFGQEDAPPALFLDFMYGVAVVKGWRAPGIQDDLNSRYSDFAYVLRTVQLPTQEDEDNDDDDNDVDVDDPKDLDYVDGADTDDTDVDGEHKMSVGHEGRHGIRHKSQDSELSQAMDLTLELSMSIMRGCPPGTTVARILQQREEEAEVQSRQIARGKVEGWLERSV